MDWQSGTEVLGLGVTLVTWAVSLMWPTIPRKVLLIFLMVGIGLMLIWPMNAMVDWLDPGPIDDKKANTTSNAKPHVAMIPRLEIVEGVGAAIVTFHNRGVDDLDKLILNAIVNIDGKDMIEKIKGESRKELPLLRANTTRDFSTYLDRKTYDEVMTGKLTLKVMSSISYSFHGRPYTESCVTMWNALAHKFDHVDC
jgi:hypothetical protein